MFLFPITILPHHFGRKQVLNVIPSCDFSNALPKAYCSNRYNGTKEEIEKTVGFGLPIIDLLSRSSPKQFRHQPRIDLTSIILLLHGVVATPPVFRLFFLTQYRRTPEAVISPQPNLPTTIEGSRPIGISRPSLLLHAAVELLVGKPKPQLEMLYGWFSPVPAHQNPEPTQTQAESKPIHNCFYWVEGRLQVESKKLVR